MSLELSEYLNTTDEKVVIIRNKACFMYKDIHR